MNTHGRIFLRVVLGIVLTPALGYGAFLFLSMPVSASRSYHEGEGRESQVGSSSLVVPPGGKISIAIVLGAEAEVLDFCGPLEVFANAYSSEGEPLFAPYFVAQSLEPIQVGSGMKVVPNYTFDKAPAPKIIVIPAMLDEEATPEMLGFIRKYSATTDLTMSVCNGAFILAKTGLLSGKNATCHHGGYFRFAGEFPDVKLQRGLRYVEDGKFVSAGGIASGIDLALHVVERYAGREKAADIADSMEYHSQGWVDPTTNAMYATLPVLDTEKSLCPLCLMKGDKSISSNYKGKLYYFCHESEKEFFDKHTNVLDRFLAEDEAYRASNTK
jgi:putative intracellular protease/amidase/YHS domain-containing protein